MKLSSRVKISALFFGDIVVLYASLALALFFRYGNSFYSQLVENHFIPFTIAFIVWIIVFYIAGLYDLRRLRNNIDFIKTLILTLLVNTAITITLFYLVSSFDIAPKTNLFLFLFIFAILETWWRRTFNIQASFREGLNRVLLIGENPRLDDIAEELKDKPQIGYEVKAWTTSDISERGTSDLRALVRTHDINLIVVPTHAKNDVALSREFYNLLASGVEVMDIPSFYEIVFRKIPISDFRRSVVSRKSYWTEKILRRSKTGRGDCMCLWTIHRITSS